MTIRLTGDSNFTARGEAYSLARAQANAEAQLNQQIRDFVSTTLTGSPGFGSLVSHTYKDSSGQSVYCLNQKVVEVWVARTLLLGLAARFVF